MIALDQVNEAKNDHSVFLNIYNQIFYDSHRHPKLRMWLKRKGVKLDEIDDLESIMTIVFAIGIDKYKHDHIPFEKWIWEKFKFALTNYYVQKKYTKKYSNLISMSDVYKPDEDKIEYDGKVIDIGYVNIDCADIDVDIEHIISMLSDIQSFICKCKLHNGWSDKEIRNFLNEKGITNSQFKVEHKMLKGIIKLYLEGKI